MFEAFAGGLFNYAQPVAFGFLFLGICIGIFIGLLPAIGGTVAMALLVPMVFGMEQVAGLSLLLAIAAISGTGGSITAILVNIPGSGPSAATLLDGFPMTRKGEAGRALGATLCADTMGGVVGVFMALAMIPVVRPLVLAMGSPELFFLIVMGISFMAILSKGTIARGMIAGLLGILLALVGYQHSTGIDRFAFDNGFLLGGLKLMPVILGLFAGAELLGLAITGKPIVPGGLVLPGRAMRRQIWMGMGDVFRHIWLWFRSCVFGYIVGIIPGIGAEVAAWAAYGQAKHTSRNPDRFGTGIIEGVIAPESSRNAKEGGAMLTTLALGIPSGASMAIFFGALLLQGVTPGQAMLETDLELTFTLLWGLALANFIGGVLCYFIAAYLKLTWITSLAPRFLVPVALTLVFAGAFAVHRDLGDVVVVVVFMLLGFGMKKLGFSRPAMILGFILGGYFESYFWLSLQSQGALFFTSPISLVIIASIVGLYSFGPLRSLIKRRRKQGVSSLDFTNRVSQITQEVTSMISIYTLSAIMLVMVTVQAVAWNFPYQQAKIAPIMVSGLIIVFAGVQLAREVRLKIKQRSEVTKIEKRTEVTPGSRRKFFIEVAWIIAFPVVIYLFGFLVSIPLFGIAYMKSHGTGWAKSITIAVLITMFVYGVFSYLLDVTLYHGLVFKHF